ncbi:insulin-like growth factor-binding protein-related protein 1 [Penaeus japonicus]|uniref:insulin-like growth factor-binding protein-related protein 1 n=1 Tax=Penaeus japonicus TaxID=27405 RepID=UPI001C70DECB|nr:insulin-like growth factor-binding protein-related protein 1 [Penaeus japonicus]
MGECAVLLSFVSLMRSDLPLMFDIILGYSDGNTSTVPPQCPPTEGKYKALCSVVFFISKILVISLVWISSDAIAEEDTPLPSVTRVPTPQDTNEAVCVCDSLGEVCGSDDVTYDSLCHLLEKTADNPELYVVVRGPCKAVPVIMSAPEDAERPEGSILVLDCEVKGYPVPDVTWELNLDDGSSFKLPGDMSSVAVQVRGGPEKFMATGWVQIMRINKDTVGTYTCVATNSEGEARASAKVEIRRAVNEKEESLNRI